MAERPRVAVRLRPPWEAADLGLALLRDQAWPSARVWLATALPLALALALPLAGTGRPWLAPLLLWWLLPVLDRPLLHVLATATFGAAPGLARTLADAPRYGRRGLAASLLWRRLSPVRGLLLPVWQLEQASGAGYRARRRQLLRRGGTQAGLLTLVWTGLRAVLALGLLAGLDFCVPHAEGQGLLARTLTSPQPAAPWLRMLLTALPTLALAAAEPFYLASAYGLYLNRRVQLEGWDLELAFRRLAARLRHQAARGAALLLALALAWAGPRLAAGTANPPPPEAVAPSAAKAALAEVLKAPEFASKERVWRLKPRSRPGPRPVPAGGPPHWLEPLAALLKLLLPAALVATLGYALWSRWRGLGPSRPAALAPEAPRRGLPPHPAALPADLAGAALALWDQGDPRAALALLYRGALAQLGRTSGADRNLGPAATEAECLRLAAGLPQAGYLARLLSAWQAVAYAGRTPDPADRRLCAEWAGQFPAPGGRP